MTGRQPLQSAANLPLKPSSASQLRPGGGFTKPASQPVRPVTLPSGPKPHHHPSSLTSNQPSHLHPSLK